MSRPALGDRELKKTRALPAGAATVKGAAIDIGFTSRADFVACGELKLSAPAVTTGMLADNATIKYAIITDDDSTFATAPVVVLTDVIVQTGAGGAGAAAASWQGKLPVGGLKKYVGVQAVKSASGDASSVVATLEALF